MSVNGEIVMVNSFGYLNAEQYPLLTFYVGMTLFYLVVAAGWGYLYWRHRTQLIDLHHFLSWILGCQIIQSVFMLIEYEIQNT